MKKYMLYFVDTILESWGLVRRSEKEVFWPSLIVIIIFVLFFNFILFNIILRMFS